MIPSQPLGEADAAACPHCHALGKSSSQEAQAGHGPWTGRWYGGTNTRRASLWVPAGSGRIPTGVSTVPAHSAAAQSWATALLEGAPRAEGLPQVRPPGCPCNPGQSQGLAGARAAPAGPGGAGSTSSGVGKGGLGDPELPVEGQQEPVMPEGGTAEGPKHLAGWGPRAAERGREGDPGAPGGERREPGAQRRRWRGAAALPEQRRGAGVARGRRRFGTAESPGAGRCSPEGECRPRYSQSAGEAGPGEARPGLGRLGRAAPGAAAAPRAASGAAPLPAPQRRRGGGTGAGSAP